MERQYRLRDLSSFDVDVQRMFFRDSVNRQIIVGSRDPLDGFTLYYCSLFVESFGEMISFESVADGLWVANQDGYYIGYITPCNSCTKAHFINLFCDTKHNDIAATSSLSGLFE